MSDGLASRFHQLFMGLESGHGTYNNINQQRDDGKRTGDPLTKRAPVTDALWQGHLDGTNGIGIIPIRADGTCLFGAIDIDVYAGLDHAEIAGKLAKLNLPMFPCRSKSGGCHVYLFAKEPVPADLMQAKLRDVAARLGFGNSELFPKQTKTTERDLGSWINMPFCGGESSNRYAIKPNGDPYDMEGFLAAAEAARVGLDFFSESKKGKESKEPPSKGKLALPDGPPCLQHLVELGVPPGTRNETLHNFAIYFRKARPSDWQKCVEDANNNLLSEPLPSTEVAPILASIGRKEYHYGCSKYPLAPHCNAVVCRSRKYGVGGGATTFPALGQLRKLLTQPPVWFLDVVNRKDETVSLELSTDDLQDPRAFQRLCMEKLNMIPQMPKREVWEQTVNQLLVNVNEMDPPPADASTEGMFWELVEQFCTGRLQAQSKEEILLGKPWTDGGRTYFRTQDLMAFLNSKQFKEYKVQQLAKVLKLRQEVQHETQRVGARVLNLWSVPEFSRREEGFPVADAVDKDQGVF